jgi:uncharacterized membrane protein YheB (UPF0754 family)
MGFLGKNLFFNEICSMFLYLIPLLGALTGIFIVRLFTWMLFNPITPSVGNLQGILPKYHRQLAQGIAHYLSQKIVSSLPELRAHLTNPSHLTGLKPMVEAHLDTYLKEKLPQTMPMISMFIGEGTISQIKTALASELDALFPQLIGQYFDQVSTNMDVQNRIETEIQSISLQQIETKLKPFWTPLYYIAAIIGFLMGCLQLALVYAS